MYYWLRDVVEIVGYGGNCGTQWMSSDAFGILGRIVDSCELLFGTYENLPAGETIRRDWDSLAGVAREVAMMRHAETRPAFRYQL